MLDVVVKTLDSQNHSFSVPDESTVKEFKAQIAPVLNIAAEKQRLIFCGKVLKDDKKLSEYDVNGKVIHVVQSLPPQSNTSSATSTSSSSTSTTSSGSSRNVPRDTSGFLLGAFAIPQDMVDPTQVQNIVQDVTGLGDIGRNATVVSRTSDDGSVDVHINLGRVPVNVPPHSEAQLRMNRIQTMLIRANHLLESLEDGGNSNNGAVADSSSQTEAENAAARSNGSDPQNGTLPTSGSEATITAEVNINPDMPTEINLENVTMSAGTERFQFEGLAHAAQAAISAAFAAAARAASSTLSSPEASPPGRDDQTSEPMDLTPPAPDLLNASDTQPDDPSVTPMDAMPSESEPSTSEQSSSKKEPADSDSHHPDCPFSAAVAAAAPFSAAAARTPPTSTGPSTSQPSRRPGAPQASVQTLANLLDEVIRVNTRLQPCLEKTRDLLRSDSVLTGRALGDAHRLFSRISQLMHFFSHAYHSLSDLHVNFTQDPPRSPSVRIISSSHNTSLFQGIPMQAQISISTSSVVVPNASQSTTTTASNASGDSSSNSGSEARPVPAPRVSQASSTANPLSYIAGSPNPVVFMEVSPGSVTIDSISAVPTPFVSGLTPDASQNSGPRPNATPSSTSGRENQPPAAEPNSGTPRATARSSSANGSTSQSMNIPLQNLIPVPLTSMGSLHTFDAGLPCHSVWALEPSRRRHNAGGSRSSSSSGVTPNAPGRQEDQLQQIIGNIMMSLLNHVPTEINRSAPRNANTEREGAAAAAAADYANFRQSVNDCRQKLAELNLLYKTFGECFPNLEFNSETLCGSIMSFLTSTLNFKNLIDLLEGKFDVLDWYEEKFNNFIQSKIQNFDEDTVDDKKEEFQQVVQEFENIIRSCSFLRERRGRKEEFYRAVNAFARDYVFKIYKAAGISKLDQSSDFGENLMRHLHFAFLEFMEILKRNTIDGFKDLKTNIMLEIESHTSKLPHPFQTAINEFFSLILSRVEKTYDLSPRHYARDRVRSRLNRTSAASSSTSSNSLFPGISLTDHPTQQFVNMVPMMNWDGYTDLLDHPMNLSVFPAASSVTQIERLKYLAIQQFIELQIINKKLAEVVRSGLFDTNTFTGRFMKLVFETLTFRDVIEITFKSYSCLNKYTDQFHTFCCDHFFDAPSQTIDLVKLERGLEEVKKMLISFTSDMGIESKPFEETLDEFVRKCAEAYLPDVVKAVHEELDQSVNIFGARAFSSLIKLFKELTTIIGKFVSVETFMTKLMRDLNEESFGLTGHKKLAVQNLFKNVIREVIFRSAAPRPATRLPEYLRRTTTAEMQSSAAQTPEILHNLIQLEDAVHTYPSCREHLRPLINKPVGEILPASPLDPECLVGRIMKSIYDNLTIQDVLALKFSMYPSILNKFYQLYLQFVQKYSSDPKWMSKLMDGTKALFKYFTVFLNVPDKSKYFAEVDQAIEASVTQFVQEMKNVSENTFGQTVSTALMALINRIVGVYERCTENGVHKLKTVAIASLTPQLEILKDNNLIDANCVEFVQIFVDNMWNQVISHSCEKSGSTSKQNSDSNDRRILTSSNRSEASRPTSSSQGVRRPNTGRTPSNLASLAHLADQRNTYLRTSGRQSNIPPVHGLTKVVIGSEGWHNSVPRDWVPIITRDVHCQRRQASQAPFSNAYLSGMPSKRRKIMANGNTTLLEPPQSALSDMLMQAILSADVKPKTNIEEVKKEAAQDAPLQVSFNEHMKQAIRERLNCDGDYCSERFPNSEKYFN